MRLSRTSCLSLRRFVLPTALSFLWFACVCLSPSAWAYGPDGAVAHDEAPSKPQGVTVAAGQPIVLGMSMPLTGPTRQLGQEFVRGVFSHVRQVNAAGGIHGRPLKLVVLDDGYEPQQTIINTRRLLEYEKVFALLGYIGTPTAQVAKPIAERAGVPFFGPFTGASFLRSLPREKERQVVFNVRPSYHDETRAMVDYLVKTRKFTRIGLLVQNDAYGNDGRNGVQKALAGYGLDIVAVAKYKRNTSDVAPAVNKLQQAGPQAVIIIGTSAPAAAFIKQAHRQGFNPLFLNVSFVGARALVSELGPEAEGVIFTQTVPSPNESGNPLVAAYAAQAPQFDPVLTSVALEGYLAAATFSRILQENGPQLSRRSFLDTAVRMGSFNVLGQDLTFTPGNHNGTSKVYFVRIENGKSVPFQP